MKKKTYYDIGVFERKDYSLCFGRTEEESVPGEEVGVGELHLYRVQLVFPEVYILASDSEGAILQATCCLPEAISPDNATAERVPFGLRGWAGTQF